MILPSFLLHLILTPFSFNMHTSKNFIFPTQIFKAFKLYVIKYLIKIQHRTGPNILTEAAVARIDSDSQIHYTLKYLPDSKECTVRTEFSKSGGHKILTNEIGKGPAQFQHFAIEMVLKTSIFPSWTTGRKNDFQNSVITKYQYLLT